MKTKMKTGRVRCYIVKPNGDSVSVDTDGTDFDGPGGQYLAAEPHETARLDGRRIVLYRMGDPKPVPIFSYNMVKKIVGGEEKWVRQFDNRPAGYSAADVKNIHGKFLPSVLRRALQKEDNTKLFTIISMIASGTSVVVSAFALWKVFEILTLLKQAFGG